MSIEPNHLTVSAAADLIGRNALTAKGLVDACLERIALRDADLHAWTYLDPALARAQALQCDQGRLAGPLRGIPVAVKDMIDTADMPTSYNSPIYKDHRPSKDAWIVRRLREAGAVIVGKTKTSEFAYRYGGLAVNPHDFHHTSGGSSSGSSVAVADFMVPLALGTQTGGSTIKPASFCGIVGFKPTHGRLPIDGTKILAHSLDTLGLLARNSKDIALVDAVLTGERDSALGGNESIHIGYCQTPLWPRAHRETQHIVTQAAEILSAHGMKLEEAVLSDKFTQLDAAVYKLIEIEAAQYLADEYRSRPDDLSELMKTGIERGMKVASPEWEEIRKLRAACALEIAELFARFDALITPSTEGEAPRDLNDIGEATFCRIWTALELPCVTLPAGVGSNGLPIGVQLVARKQDDRKLLALAQRAEPLLCRSAATPPAAGRA